LSRASKGNGIGKIEEEDIGKLKRVTYHVIIFTKWDDTRSEATKDLGILYIYIYNCLCKPHNFPGLYILKEPGG